MTEGSSEPAHLGRAPRPRLYEQIAPQLYERISEGGLRPGDQLPTHEISDLVRESRLESLAHIELVSDVAVLRDGDGPAA